MEPLPPDHIRLLCIEAGSAESPIRCKLQATSLHTPPPYEALSYTWGSTEQESAITCGGSDMLVTRNLFDVLQYLRKPESQRIMWIDAVCINQRNDQERTEQVGMMKDIYKKALHVVIWLGRDTLEDKAAFSLLNRFEDVFAKHGLVNIGPESFSTAGLPKMGDPDWVALVKLFQRPWFRRIWVVQEAAMACESTVVCGSYSVKWDHISNVARSVRMNGHLGQFPVGFFAPGISSVVVIYHLSQAHKDQDKTWGLLGMLRLTRKYMATDPRDKVFAMMGVVTTPGSMGLDLDYRLSAEEVYLSVATHNLEELKDLELLANSGVSSAPENPKLPSWVPDWSHRNDGRAIIAATAKRVGFCASGESQPMLSISADRKILTIRGAVIDTISQLDTSVLVEEEESELDHTSQASQARIALRSKACFANFAALAEGAHKFPEGHSREESLWRTLCGNQTAGIPPERAPPEYATAYRLIRKYHKVTAADGSMDIAALHRIVVPVDYSNFTAFMNQVGEHCTGRNLCVTAGGYLGSVPNGSITEDKVCILFGSRVPFVLRECGKGLFKLVGECYIHGIMDGEAMKRGDMEVLSRDFEIA
ncbi:hypothetical protein G7Y89_g4718 [Cudoniella acicularis]|uniref:Heterokaryon incompatibility domain-containing protein n=1 Tax=Cudoniella acicularis TaxID=354080 RepID=A0A8H4RR27_9HELO|nr:hypothetical protein G7Y89_g4718 [Cudoniella acicularis]